MSADNNQFGLLIDPRAVEKMVADAVLKSALGDTLQVVINKSLQTLSRTWDNPIEIEVKRLIREMIIEVLREHHQETIKEAVAKHVAELLTDEMFAKIARAAFDKLGV